MLAIGPSCWVLHLQKTPFQHAPKGLEIFNYGKWLKDALESDGETSGEFRSIAGISINCPREHMKKILEEYDVIIFSDVEGQTFSTCP